MKRKIETAHAPQAKGPYSQGIISHGKPVKQRYWSQPAVRVFHHRLAELFFGIFKAIGLR